MACTSTKPSLGSPLDLSHPHEPSGTPAERVSALQEENERLRRICASLIDRVEAGGTVGGAPYAAFEHTVLLAEQVRERTETLQQTLLELHQAKAEAEAANHSKTRFLAAVSHDLLQPLNAARLFTCALEEHDLPGPTRRLVGNVGRSLKDVEALLGTLVDISRLDAGLLRPDRASFRASELLDVLAEEYCQMAAARGLELRYVASHTAIESDLALLARVVRNFLSNAIRYTQQGRILLGCRHRREGLEIVVGDTGPGIEPALQQAIFLEFRRLGSSPDERDRGLGLGLAIVDRISAMLGHSIRLVSRPGQGALFSILVPYAVPARRMTNRTALEPRQDTTAPLSGATVWVIDNDRAIREGMQALLSGWGCRVITAASLGGLEAKVDARRPDALLIDYHLGEDAGAEDGIAVASLLRKRHAELPVVLITANHDAAIKARARREGFDCLLKPLKPLRLRMMLQQRLASGPGQASANDRAQPC
ncbi:hybrid sensor histidine kinase/response regulator [Billgrantia diversa]|uniref:hybrid sensor histidine kinase/response regulator n=1 Tax=Halomonas sp. MCCC 1A13316 TaxID=2733487 RepID=UPI0018A370B8|nr:hybrid sensor histidine kinase/response regulator [Halomonas sp. MCCC 1A13316]QOR39842.1 hybrid sensor histidine kinase/response regulator [Halomonas sp. MCCC 1A13316]